MAVYCLIALLADLNTSSCVNSQVYQTRGVLVTKVALHIFLLSCPRHAQKRGIPRHTGQEYPLQKAQKGGYRRLFVRGCFRSNAVRLLLLVLSFGYASASFELLVRLALRLALLAPSPLLPLWLAMALLPLDSRHWQRALASGHW
jgi:hypothetical protein